MSLARPLIGVHHGYLHRDRLIRRTAQRMGGPVTFRAATQRLQVQAAQWHGDNGGDGIVLEALQHRDAAEAFIGVHTANRDPLV